MTQLSFSTLWQGYATNKEAKAARDAEYRKQKAAGMNVRRWILKNQVKKYGGFGIEDGRICDVYLLNIYGEDPAL